MTTQSFIADMQVISTSRMENNAPTSQHQSRSSSQVAQSSQAQVSRTQASNHSGTQKVVSVAQDQQEQSSQGSRTTVTVAVVAPSHSQSRNQQLQTQQQSVVVQASSTGGTRQFIAVAVPQPDGQGQGTVALQAAQPTYVQYVDDGSDPEMFGGTNASITGYPVYSVTDSATMYSPATAAAYYSTGTAVTYSQVGSTVSASAVGIQGQLLAHQAGGAYLVQHTAIDSDGNPLAHTTRASPATVQWLIDNYETAEGVSLPRSTLYNHYMRHCTEHKLEPVNAASFGKLIRSVFLGLRTRRLGTRGNSKYHYYGIRVKPNSPLNHISEDFNSAALRHQSVNSAKSEAQQHQLAPHQYQHQLYLGDASAAIPNLDLDSSSFSLPDDIEIEDVHAFRVLYKEHCEAFLDAVITLQFSTIETLWRSFWRTQNNGQSTNEKILNKSSLYKLCFCEEIQKLVRKADYQFYQNLVDVLIPDVLRPIPSSLTQAIRNFAKSLESWLTSAMAECPEEMIRIKVSAVSAFAQTLRRYTSLNHLAQAARAVLQNSSQISQMLADLNRVDFHNVQEQASWVCQCEDEMVQHLEQDFKMTLQQQNSLEQWAAWLEGVVNLVLQPFKGKPDFPKAARQFLLKWSFYSSMVIRDLTLRSAASFGSFHLIRLLYDEYMFYLIEHKVAKALGETPIAVMGEFIGLGVKHDMAAAFPTLHRNSTDAGENGSSEALTSIEILPNNSPQSSSCSTGTYSNGLKDSSSSLTSFQHGLIVQSHLDVSDSLSETKDLETTLAHSNKTKDM
ncbi:DNA-binding protein RFX2-like isoform X2 [Tachypleus tridentatus]|uniref:DNA-binding protein RFX2-like isoform X2 n=1 Tax=Tachypleus tridentatus TaxID=6853 RepID=UPI003FD01F73